MVAIYYGMDDLSDDENDNEEHDHLKSSSCRALIKEGLHLSSSLAQQHGQHIKHSLYGFLLGNNLPSPVIIDKFSFLYKRFTFRATEIIRSQFLSV